MPITIKIPLCPKIAQTLFSSALNVHILNRNILTTAFSTQNIIVPRLIVRTTLDIPHSDILNLDAVGGVARGTAIQVVLLDIDAIDGDVLKVDVFVEDIGNEACGV